MLEAQSPSPVAFDLALDPDDLPEDRSAPTLRPLVASASPSDTQQKLQPASSFAQSLRDRTSGILVALLLVGFWEVAPRFNWLDPQFFPPPSAIARATWTLASTGELFVHIAWSLGRTVSGLSAAALAGIPLGLVLAGFFPNALRVFRGLFSIMGQINAFSLFPLFVLFFGIGEPAKFLIIFWSCFWPLLTCAINGVKSVDPNMIKTARSMGCNSVTLLRDVLLPAALPVILGGARLAATFAFLMLVAAEMIGAKAGLGWMVHNASVNYVLPRLYMAALLIGTLGISLTRCILFMERRLVRWQ